MLRTVRVSKIKRSADEKRIVSSVGPTKREEVDARDGFPRVSNGTDCMHNIQLLKV